MTWAILLGSMTLGGCNQEDAPITQKSSSLNAEEKPTPPSSPNSVQKKPEGVEPTLDQRTPPPITPATEWVRSLTARRECNRVMGCPAMDKLIEMGASALPDLHRVLDGSPPIAPFRPVVLETLGKIGDPSSTPWLLKEMTAPLWPNRVEACIALGRVGDKSVIPALEKVVKREGDWTPPTIAGAAYALYLLGVQTYKHELLALTTPEAIETINWGYTRFGIQLGMELNFEEILPGARKGLGHGDYFLREASLAAIQHFDDRKSIEELLPLLKDKVPSLRKKAETTLRKWSGKNFNNPDEWSKWCIEEKHCKGKTSSETEPEPSPGDN